MPDEEWSLVIKPKSSWFDFHLKELWKYRDLIMVFVRRDFVSLYKQTLLGPLWYFIQPLITTLTFTIIFSRVAKISTDGIPPILFYFSGITLWTYFADCLNRTSNTFISNIGIFGKVYFPRLTVPLSVIISNLVKLGIQMALFLCVWSFTLLKGNSLHPNYSYLVFLPFLIAIMSGLGLSFGILISSLTTKYRDLTFLVGFGVQLMMYASPVVYPLSIVSPKSQHILLMNPVTSIIEAFKFIFLGTGVWHWMGLLYSVLFMIVSLFFSIMLFNKVEKSFMDTV